MVPMPEINGSALTMTDMMRYPRPTNIWDSHRVRRRVAHRIGTHAVRHSQPSTYPTSTFSLRDTHTLSTVLFVLLGHYSPSVIGNSRLVYAFLEGPRVASSS